MQSLPHSGHQTKKIRIAKTDRSIEAAEIKIKNLPSLCVVHLHPVVAVYPDGKNSEDDIGDNSAQNAEDHNIGEVLEEALATHVVRRCEHDGRDAEVEEDVVVEDDVLLDHVVV